MRSPGEHLRPAFVVMRASAATLVLMVLLVPAASAQQDTDPHRRHHHSHPVAPASDGGSAHAAGNHHSHGHDIGPAGSTYDLRWIDAMGQWRRAWYPEAPVYPVVLKAGGDPNSMAGLERMSTAQIQAMQMLATTPTRDNRVTWFLDGMIAHHGGALVMARDALAKSGNATLRRLAQNIIVAQRREIMQLRQMLQHDGFNKPAVEQYDGLSNW